MDRVHSEITIERRMIGASLNELKRSTKYINDSQVSILSKYSDLISVIIEHHAFYVHCQLNLL